MKSNHEPSGFSEDFSWNVNGSIMAHVKLSHAFISVRRVGDTNVSAHG
jgi:hypothetical protein